MVLVFQYGSNSLESEVNGKDRLCGDAKFVDIAETVEDFELAFDVCSTVRSCAASDIVRKPGGKVWGVLYEVPDYLIGRETAKARGRKSLDAIEGECKNYKRETISVCRPKGAIVSALTYTVKRPSLDWRRILSMFVISSAACASIGFHFNTLPRLRRLPRRTTPASLRQWQSYRGAVQRRYKGLYVGLKAFGRCKKLKLAAVCS